MGNAMKHKLKRVTRDSTTPSYVIVKGGVVPAGSDIRFSAYKVPGKAPGARVYDETRRVLNGAGRLLKTGMVAGPKIVLESQDERTR